MNLNNILSNLTFPKLNGNTSTETVFVKDVQSDSRLVTANSLFVCIIGNTVDGHDFIDNVIKKGATVIVHSKELAFYNPSISYIQVKDTNRALAAIANTYYNSPSTRMKLIGVTGTNGKTTTTNIIEHIFNNHAPKSTGIIGTIETRYADLKIPSANTTPNSLELQKLLNQMAITNTTHVAMEVSSHALILGRTWGTEFETAVFTNLTQDHLDFHKDMDDYASAKSLLFSRLSPSKKAIINVDDSYAEYFIQRTQAHIVSYGIDSEADFRATNVVLSAKGTSFTLELPTKSSIDVSISLIGKFNVYNVLASIATAYVHGISVEESIRSIQEIKGVDGRFESVEAGQDFSVIVDYAHTPDSLENVLKTARELTRGKVITVVGCGGDRDKTKRPIMANIAQQYSDFVVLTSDNPRTENPTSILNDMENGLDSSKLNTITIEDRSSGIDHAINGFKKLDAFDTVIIAGKGHETYQIIGKEKTHFDDREHAISSIKKTADCL